MNVEELPMILFTVIGQMSVGAFWTLGAIHAYGHYKKTSTETIDQITNAAMYAVGGLLILGFFAAFFHLHDPFHALNTLRHFNTSWLTREISFGVLYGACGFLFATTQWFNLLTRQLREVFAILTALTGLGLVISMCGVYYSLETIPAWHTPATWFFFFASTLLTGPLAVGISLLVTWQIQMKTATLPTPAVAATTVASVVSTRTTGTAGTGAVPSHTTGTAVTATTSTQSTGTAGTGAAPAPSGRNHLVALLKRVLLERVFTGRPTPEMTALTARALQGICLVSALSGMVLLVTYPLHITSLANGNEAAQEVAHRMMDGHYLLIRLVLLAAAVILAGIFAFIRARDAVTPSRALVTIIVLAFALALTSELLGRGLHYEGLWHIGLNTPQTLLGH